ncbi:hypothetical protein SHELI_v1c04060 [Spiroplasma helicoides]|uniref:Uncharacterized protein n=1 Tax=Spiroplasma helicoides TaxID=216938 RepID=A0A1B3SK99_9MOLU|nr:hypothetical protein [Spiroplasma helicoides]AOG60357.1 hypothetical protein SHELI_v1c04060 [Spiroplasma helicoides]
MKKLLILLSSINILPTLSILPISCKEQKEYYMQGKSDIDVVELLTPDFIIEKKLKDDYKDTLSRVNNGVSYSHEGTYIDDSIGQKIKLLFKDSNTYPVSSINSDTKETEEWFFTLRGDKDSVSFELFFVEAVTNKGDKSVECKTLFSKTINISY